MLIIPLFAAALFTASPWTVRDHIPPAEFIVQAHRGAGDLAPENSLESFQLAWRLGAIPEADLRTTRDGVIVAFHDNDFRRILPARARQTIQDLPWSEVSRLDVGAWKGPQFAGQRVPNLAQLVQSLTGRRRLYIDIKNVDLAQLARETRPSGAAARLILASTDYALVRRWKQLAPESSTVLWMGGTEQALEARFAELRRTGFAGVTQLQIHVRADADGTLHPSAEFLTRAGAELRRHGILFQVFPWNCRDRAVFFRLLDLGVASFASDYPDATLEYVRQYYGAARACAHRGDQEAAPENTIPAIRSAVEKGARQIEFDVKFTRDRRLVILHDATLNRTTNGRGPLIETDFADARALDAGAWFRPQFAGTRIPTLEEVLAAIPQGILMNVHLAEQPGLAAAVARVLREKYRDGDAFLACSAQQAVEAHALVPGLRICNMSRQGGDTPKYVEQTIAIGAQFIQLRDAAGGVIPPDLAAHCRRLHDHGITVNYFGAQDEAKIRALAAAGVDYILTDRLSLCRQVLNEPAPQ